MLATAESKNQAVSKLESLIERGRSRAASVIDHVMRHQPTDRLVRGDALQFRAAENLPEVLITLPDREQEKVDQTLHRNAIYQMAQTTEMPVKFLDSLQAVAEPWGRELLAHNLQTVFNRRFQKKRYLLRSLQQEVRGFLSDSYRRIDSRPVVEAFATAVQEKGALPYEGYVTDTKIAIQAIMPEVYEPVPGEVVAYGLVAGELRLRQRSAVRPRLPAAHLVLEPGHHPGGDAAGTSRQAAGRIDDLLRADL